MPASKWPYSQTFTKASVEVATTLLALGLPILQTTSNHKFPALALRYFVFQFSMLISGWALMLLLHALSDLSLAQRQYDNDIFDLN